MLLAKSMVRKSGISVETILDCNNGLEAMNILSENQVDVMFTDIRMPYMDGIELAKKVQEMERSLRPIIVAISGYDDFQYAVSMMGNGARDYLLKPVQRERLYEILTKLEKEIQEREAA